MKYLALTLIFIGFLFCFLAGVSRESANQELFKIAILGACLSYLFAFAVAYVATARADHRQ